MSTMRGQRVPIGKLLVDQGKITQEQLKQGLAMQKNSTEKLGSILVDLGFVSERDVLAAYAQQLNIPFYDPAKLSQDPLVAKSIPDNLIQRYNVVPLRRNGGKLMVAMQDPTNVFVLDDLRLITGFEIEPVLATSDDVQAIRRGGPAPAAAAAPATAPAGSSGGVLPPLDPIMSSPTASSAQPKPDKNGAAAASGNASSGGSLADINGMLDAIRRPDVAGDREDDAEIANDAPIIRMVNVLIQTAVKDGASDIHVEPERKNVRIRYRIDGVLYETMTLPKFVHAPLSSRLKIMADINIAERRIPQDGRIHIRHDGSDYDMRVNTLPTVWGEKVVMRILKQDSVLIGMKKLGFLPEMEAELEQLVTKPNGMVLVTGPTGSGKTTTLYSILNRINSVEKNILTVEDPVEYQLPGINQVTVNRKAGLTFPLAMRSFLRQDPDIIMVGEVRDLETAEIAVQASLTGHLVLSSLHTNDAPATIIRLTDMGVEPFLISAAVIGCVAQRLGRTLCEACKEPTAPPVQEILRYGLKEEELQGATFFKPVGCEVCSNRGYKGRVGIYELLVLNEEIAEMIVRRAPLSEITQAGLAGGMTTLMRDGLNKAMRGQTTIEEVLRCVSGH